MAELADAYGSGPYESNFIQVQVLLPAPNEKTEPYSSWSWVRFFIVSFCNIEKILQKYENIVK